MGKTAVAFVGLGVMGYPMAGWLSQKGHSVTVYNRTTEVAQRWVDAYRGELAHTPKSAAENVEGSLSVWVMTLM